MRSLPCAALVLLIAAPDALAREADPQAHELRVDLDVQVEKLANGAVLDAQYTFTPGKLDRLDEVVPVLRRFVRHPSAVWLRALRNGHTREPQTGIFAGGVLQLGPAYASAEVGIESDDIDYAANDFENGFLLLPVLVEVGARPVELLSVGAFYSLRPVIGHSLDSELAVQAQRSGSEQRIGGRLGLATPNDRVYLTASAWAHLADWTFVDYNPGDLTVRGFGVEARLALQVTASLSVIVRGELRRDHWNDQRTGDDQTIGPNLERDVLAVAGGLEMLYWYKGRYAFRFGLGGGWEGAPPTVNNRETPLGQMRLGVVTRF